MTNKRLRGGEVVVESIHRARCCVMNRRRSKPSVRFVDPCFGGPFQPTAHFGLVLLFLFLSPSPSFPDAKLGFLFFLEVHAIGISLFMPMVDFVSASSKYELFPLVSSYHTLIPLLFSLFSQRTCFQLVIFSSYLNSVQFGHL